jgi:RND family efflux transporter MFP subunit
MRSILFIATGIFYLFFMGCNTGQENKNEQTNHSNQQQNEHAGHNHTHSEESHSHDENQDEHSHDQSQEHEHEHEHNKEHSHEHGENTESHEEATTNHEEHDHAKTEEHNHEHEYMVEKIQPGDFHEVLRTSGKIMHLPKNKANLVAPVSGIVEFADNSVLPGKPIKKDEILFRISGESVAEDNLMVKYRKSKNSFRQAKSDYERAQKLKKEQLISEKEYLQHKTDYLNAKSDFETIRTHVEKNSGVVKSNIPGYLKNVLVEEGDHVKAGQKLAYAVNNNRLLLKAEVSQRYAARLDEFSSANFETPDGKLYNTGELNGKLVSTGKSTTNESFYLPVYFSIDNTGGLVPGSFVHIFLIGEKKHDVLALPKDAFIEEQGNFFVYVEKDNEFQKTAVTIGAEDGKKILVKNGIKAGDRVVTHGAFQVKMEQTASALPAHGHSH